MTTDTTRIEPYRVRVTKGDGAVIENHNHDH